jgi:predicted nucleic acid-binding protein
MVLVDANVLLDVVTAHPVWSEWSQRELAQLEADGLAINPILYAELAPASRTEAELAAVFRIWPLQRLTLLTRDATRYRTHFPQVPLIRPA